MYLDSNLQSFAIENQLAIIEGEGGFPFIKIDNAYASALISIYGGQVLSYKNKSDSSAKDLLFVSDKAYFEKGESIKGGIPICWPWFGNDQENVGKHIHGFARDMFWQLDETSLLDKGETQVVLSLTESDKSLQIWPHEFKLILTILIGETLSLSLKTINTGEQSFKITQALHTYFSVADIAQTVIQGMDQINYLDKVTGLTSPEVTQVGNIEVTQEVDRIYVNAPSQVKLLDKKAHREVTINSKGSKTVVVWNPWIDISKESEDLSDDAYLQFVCIETANAIDDLVKIEPKESHTIEVEYLIS